MKSKVFFVTWIVTATILGLLSVGLIHAKPTGIPPASVSVSVQPTASGGERHANSLPASMNLPISVPDIASWPEPVLYLLFGAALIGIAVGTKHVARIRGKALRMGNLSENSELEVLASASSKQADPFKEHAHNGRR